MMEDNDHCTVVELFSQNKKIMSKIITLPQGMFSLQLYNKQRLGLMSNTESVSITIVLWQTNII